jgi:hypothetical protein
MPQDSLISVIYSFPAKLHSIYLSKYRFFSSTEIQNAKASGKPFRDQRYVDVYREKAIRVVVKVIVPVKEYPKV